MKLLKLRPIAGLVLKGEKYERFLEFPTILLRHSYKNRRIKNENPKAIGFGFEYIKRRLLRKIYPHLDWYFLPFGRSNETYRNLISEIGPDQFWVWSFRDHSLGIDIEIPKDCKIQRVEDGFLRSFGLGVGGAPPRSLCIDETGLYFYAKEPSDLETILNNFETYKTPELMERARQSMSDFIKSGVTKYNLTTKNQADMPKEISANGRIVLVLGQVEDDQSILLNDNAIQTNRDLIKQALIENPHDTIVYRPHPDVSAKLREKGSDVDVQLDQVLIAPEHQAISDILPHADMVYTISSLAGFEALLRGIPVKTFGNPFYAGWGATEDAVTISRRTAKRSPVELFAAAYLIYPKYFDPQSGEARTFEDTLHYFLSPLT